MKRIFLLLLALVLLTAPVAAAGHADGATVVEEWNLIPAPPAVQLESVYLDTATTAFLVLDIQTPMCSDAQRPRCAASIPKIAAFLQDARAKGMFVAYSLTPTGTPANIAAAVAPRPGEPVVKSSVDKFYGTDLEKILKDKGIRTVVIVGTAAHGAVLHTATGAAMRGFQVVVPVDGMSSAETYAEQYTAWHMLNGPGTRGKATLTKFGMIGF